MRKNNRFPKHLGWIIATLLFGFLEVQAQPHEYVVIQHQEGETKVKKNPVRVVIFDVGTLETYDELGIPVYGVSNSVPDYLSKYNADRYVKLGSIVSPDVDAVKAAKPDLILISGRQSKVYDELSAIAPTVFLGVDTENYWDSFEKNVRFIAEVHGKEELAEQKLAELRKKRDLVREKTASDPSRALVVMHVRGGHSAYGKGSRFGFPHDVLGLHEAHDIEVQGHIGQRIKEDEDFLEKANPDYILLIDRDSAVGGERKATDELLSRDLKQTNAYKSNKVINLPGNIWYVSGGGLYSVDKQITDIGQQLYDIEFE